MHASASSASTIPAPAKPIAVDAPSGGASGAKGLIAPHGGSLQNRLAHGAALDALQRECAGLRSLTLSAKQSCDLEMITIGAFSPLLGFMGQADVESVCRRMRLADGTVWSIPILLSVKDADKPRVGERVLLKAPNGVAQAVINVREVFKHDKELEIPSVFRTTDAAHPGVKQVMD